MQISYCCYTRAGLWVDLGSMKIQAIRQARQSSGDRLLDRLGNLNLIIWFPISSEDVITNLLCSEMIFRSGGKGKLKFESQILPEKCNLNSLMYLL